jgi:V/A-type H+-transporting ATPase subunit E
MNQTRPNSAADKPKSSDATSAGVDALIARLRDEGVAKGRAEAARIEQEATQAAARLRREAEVEVEQVLAEARREAAAMKTAGEDALRLAMRDTVLRLKSVLTREVNEKVQRLISREMEREEFLQQMILAVVRRAGDEVGVGVGDNMEVVLPHELVDIEPLRRNPLELREGSLSHFVLAVASEVLGEGVHFSAADDDAQGIRIRLKDKRVEIDLTDEKVAELILAHLQPRFRAILEGTVK